MQVRAESGAAGDGGGGPDGRTGAADGGRSRKQPRQRQGGNAAAAEFAVAASAIGLNLEMLKGRLSRLLRGGERDGAG